MTKRRFTIDEVINMTDNVYYVTADDDCLRQSLGVTRQDVIDLCDLKDIGFENVRWVKDIFEEFGGCWVAEKDEHEVDKDKHGGMVVCLSVRVGRMLDEYCKRESKNEDVRIRTRVEDLMYGLNESLDKWNGDNQKGVERIILILEDLREMFLKIRDKQVREIEVREIEEKEITGTF